jgi:hypothetical protein
MTGVVMGAVPFSGGDHEDCNVILMLFGARACSSREDEDREGHFPMTTPSAPHMRGLEASIQRARVRAVDTCAFCAGCSLILFFFCSKAGG